MPRGGERPKCSVEGCENPHSCRGMCLRHVLAWRRNGDLVSRKKIRGTCSVVGCSRPHKGHGLCETHLLRKRKHGSPEIVLRSSRTRPVGSVRTVSGRSEIKLPHHRHATRRGWAPLAKVMFEETYGPCLDQCDRVSFNNGMHGDVRPDNLVITTSRYTSVSCKHCRTIVGVNMYRASTFSFCSKKCMYEYAIGRSRVFESRRKFTRLAVYELRCLHYVGVSQAEIVRRSGIEQSVVHYLVRGISCYKDVPFPTFLEDRKMVSATAKRTESRSESSNDKKPVDWRAIEKRLVANCKRTVGLLFEIAQDAHGLLNSHEYLEKRWNSVPDKRDEFLEEVLGVTGMSLYDICQMYSFASTKEAWNAYGTRMDKLRHEAAVAAMKRKSSNGSASETVKRSGPVPLAVHKKKVEQLAKERDSAVTEKSVAISEADQLKARVKDLEVQVKKLEGERDQFRDECNRLRGRLEEVEKLVQK